MAIICDCNKGYASTDDLMCKHCREARYSPTRALCNKFGIKRGEGLTLYSYYKVTNKALWLVKFNINKTRQ